jgi:hypothetical protein
MINMKKIVLASAILTTGSIASTQQSMDINTTMENDGVLNINGAWQFNFANDATIEHFGKINFVREDAETKIALNGGNAASGINVHLGKEFRPMTGMIPKALVENKNDPLIKEFFSALAQMSYYSMTQEGGSINVKTGVDDPISLTANSELINYFTDETNDDVPRIRFDAGEKGLFDFLSQEGNNIANNVMILRGEEQDLSLDNSEVGNYTAENPFVIETAIANSEKYQKDFVSKDSDQTKTLTNAQNLNVNGNFNFKADNEYFTDGKVSFESGKSTISSVDSMFQSDIDVKNGAELVLNPQCDYYEGEVKVGEDKKTITYNKTMNVAGKLTVQGGKLVIGSNAILNFGPLP